MIFHAKKNECTVKRQLVLILRFLGGELERKHRYIKKEKKYNLNHFKPLDKKNSHKFSTFIFKSCCSEPVREQLQIGNNL